MTTRELLLAARASMGALALTGGEERRAALRAMAARLRSECAAILAANAEDLETAKVTVAPVMLDRLRLDEARVEAMAAGVEAVAALPDPLGRVLSETTRPDGLLIRRVSVPMGLIAIIYESRPNVTSDAAALCLKSGNVAVLRGGKEAFCSNRAIAHSLRRTAEGLGYDPAVVSFVEDTARQSAKELMEAEGLVDLLIPRGGRGLIRACMEGAKVPCIQTGTGICHVYIDGAADLLKGLSILENAKVSRPSVCNACEVCLVDKACAAAFLPLMKERLADKDGVQLRLDTAAAGYIAGAAAGAEDFDTEFLDYVLAVKVVDGVKDAVAHIAAHSTGHSECIVTEDPKAAAYFLQRVDSAAVYHNASTRFTDGGEFGLGCEIGIATQKVGARGPMGLGELTSYKYIVKGDGQIR